MGQSDRSTRVMVVEDEGIVALDIQDSLEKLGYQVGAVAATGDEAVEAAARSFPDLILMDIRLGAGMDGVEAAMTIRQRTDIPVIYLSAYTDEETLVRAKNTGPYGYLVKPFSEAELRTTIEMALYKHAMERRLIEHEQWLDTTLRSIGDGVIATQADGKVLFMNPAAQRLTAWPEAEALGQDFGEVFKVVVDGFEDGREWLFARVVRSGRAAELKADTWVRTRDGRTFPAEDSAAPILARNGTVTGVVLVFRDIAEKQAAAKALRDSEERLLHAQKIESLGRLAGGIAHDFNNMLVAIKGYSEILLESMAEEDPRRAMVAEIHEAGERAATLTQRLLAYSRKQVLAPVPVDMNAAVMSMVGMLRRLVGNGIDLVTEVNPLPGRIKVDPGQLEQVIMNLVVNARDAMPGGGRVIVRTSPASMDGSSRPCGPADRGTLPGPGEFALLQVIDNGVGMDKATVERIFEPFFTTKASGKGTGLGLSMVWGIVRQAGGCVTVSSEPGRGSIFSAFFPIPRPETPESGVTEGR